MFPIWPVSGKLILSYLSALYYTVYTKNLFLPILFDTQSKWLAQVGMLQIGYSGGRREDVWGGETKNQT